MNCLNALIIKKIDDKIYLLILQNKLKNIIVTIIDLISVMARNFEKALTKRLKNVVNTFIVRKIDEKNTEDFFNIKKNDLFYNAVIQQLRQSNVREMYTSEQ